MTTETTQNPTTDKTLARIMAVVAIYHRVANPTEAPKDLDDIEAHTLFYRKLAHGEDPDGYLTDPKKLKKIDKRFFKSIASGSIEKAELIKEQISACLAPGWEIERIGMA